MWSLLYLLPLIHPIQAQNSAISVADLPQCARDCLSNSTQVVSATCTSLNVACLCNTPGFVSAFYCCLSTQCNTTQQATAITFNQQQCAAVNATAPDFVGCSPLKTSSAVSNLTSVTFTISGSTIARSTIASIVSESATPIASAQVTATFAGAALLTGSCTAPLFALVSASNTARLFPEIGCAPSRQQCCPFDLALNAVITKCPQDHFTTANGCCPSGYKVYSMAIGSQTSCYSPISTLLIPASTPSISGLTVVTDYVFSRKYALAQAEAQPPATNDLSTGGIVGISVVAATCFITTAFILFWLKRRRDAQTKKANRDVADGSANGQGSTPQHELGSPHELASPEVMQYTPGGRSLWPMRTFASWSEQKIAPIAKNLTPLELPGSTYLNEHHPAFGGSDTPTDGSVTGMTIGTPTRSPMTSNAGTPMGTPTREISETNAMSPATISSYGSPRLTRTITD